MARNARSAGPSRSGGSGNPFRMRRRAQPTEEIASHVHVIGPDIICDTERRGHPTPRGRSPLELVVDASEGFIPLWEQGMTLRWRFRDRSLESFTDPEAAKAAIRTLMGEALLAWGDSAPIRFVQDDDVWDFEVVVRHSDECNIYGCVLASAFFPDGGRHDLTIYPMMFEQAPQERLETMIHEFGHIFGLRHFFALLSEEDWPAQIFGAHRETSIMNYGDKSQLTEDDKADLKKLYELAWSGELTHINGTPIRFMRPYHMSAYAEAVTVAL